MPRNSEEFLIVEAAEGPDAKDIEREIGIEREQAREKVRYEER